MKIKTKYNVGDIVIIMINGNLVPGEIKEIEFKIRSFKELKYHIETFDEQITEEIVVTESYVCCKYSTRNAKRLMLECLLKVNEKGKEK